MNLHRYQPLLDELVDVVIPEMRAWYRDEGQPLGPGDHAMWSWSDLTLELLTAAPADVDAP